MRLYLFLEGRRLGEAMGRGDLRCHNGSLHPCGPTLPLKGRGIAYERRAPPSPFSPKGEGAYDARPPPYAIALLLKGRVAIARIGEA